ncbi:MAG: zinc ribbon domain-containing protein [Planctomycetota bacterium]
MYDDPEEDFDDEPDVPCQSCGEPIYGDADRCPHCGHWQTDEFADRPEYRSRYPWWVSITSGLLLVGIAYWWLTTL